MLTQTMTLIVLFYISLFANETWASEPQISFSSVPQGSQVHINKLFIFPLGSADLPLGELRYMEQSPLKQYQMLAWISTHHNSANISIALTT